MVYLADKFGGTQPQPKPSAHCVRKVEERKNTQHPLGKRIELTRIRKTPTGHMGT